MVCLEELEPDCKILKVFERFPKIWKVPDIFGKFWCSCNGSGFGTVGRFREVPGRVPGLQ